MTLLPVFQDLGELNLLGEADGVYEVWAVCVRTGNKLPIYFWPFPPYLVRAEPGNCFLGGWKQTSIELEEVEGSCKEASRSLDNGLSGLWKDKRPLGSGRDRWTCPVSRHLKAQWLACREIPESLRTSLTLPLCLSIISLLSTHLFDFSSHLSYLTPQLTSSSSFPAFNQFQITRPSNTLAKHFFSSPLQNWTLIFSFITDQP